MNSKDLFYSSLFSFLTILLLGILFAVGCSEDCGCKPKEVSPETAVFMGSEFWKIPGPANSKGKITYDNVRVFKYQIEGHDYRAYELQGWDCSGFVHDPNCRKCQEENHSQTYSISSDYQKIFGGL